MSGFSEADREDASEIDGAAAAAAHRASPPALRLAVASATDRGRCPLLLAPPPSLSLLLPASVVALLRGEIRRRSFGDARAKDDGDSRGGDRLPSSPPLPLPLPAPPALAGDRCFRENCTIIRRKTKRGEIESAAQGAGGGGGGGGDAGEEAKKRSAESKAGRR